MSTGQEVLYQNYPEVNESPPEDQLPEGQQKENDPEDRDNESEDAVSMEPVQQYNLPPVPVPVPCPVDHQPTEKTQLLTTSSSLESKHVLDSQLTCTSDKSKKSSVTKDIIQKQRDELTSVLTHFTHIEQVFVKEHMEITEFGISRPRIFKVLDPQGHRILSAHLSKNDGCCGEPLRMVFKDLQEHEIIHMTVPWSSPCCVPTCQCFGSVSVQLDQEGDSPIGSIEQCWSFWTIFSSSLIFEIRNPSNDLLFTVIGPSFSSSSSCFNNCFQEGEFKILTHNPDRKEIGKIGKNWSLPLTDSGKKKELLGVNFPGDLSPVDKCQLITMCLLLDLTYF